MPSEKINSHLREATAFVQDLAKHVPLTTVVIDDWREAIRLIYGGPNNPNCGNNCGDCPLFQAVGPDDPKLLKPDGTPQSELNFIQTLAKPELPRDTQLAPNVRNFVNCMSLAQYMSFYTAWLVQVCEDEGEILKELELVEGMRIVYHRGIHDLNELESVVKRLIVENALWQLPEDHWRVPLIIKHAERLGLI